MSVRISLPQSQRHICFSHSDISDPTTSHISTIIVQASLAIIIYDCNMFIVEATDSPLKKRFSGRYLIWGWHDKAFLQL